MSSSSHRWIALLGLLILSDGPSPAYAQVPAKPSSPPPVPSEPTTMTAGYGDWTLRCQRVGEGDKGNRTCEVAQAMQVQGQAAPIAQIALGRIAGGEPLRLTVVLPPNLAFAVGVRIFDADKDPAATDLAWRRCLPGGCFADAEAKEPILKRWRGATEPGRITFQDAAGRDIAIPLSFRGLGQALDALAKERP